jgi:hypothetical protein
MPAISREDLYEEVWARPMIKVAADRGVTGTGLKKICDRHNIPTPERGYWAKLEHGKRVRKQPLPGPWDPHLANVRLPDLAPLPQVVRQAKTNALEQLAKTAQAAPEAAAKLDGAPQEAALHPALFATRRAIAKARPDAAGFAIAKGRGIVSLKVASASIDQALGALSRLFELAETQCYERRVTEVGLELVVDGEPVRFELEERPKDSLHQPTPAELKRKAELSRWGHARDPWRKYDQVPSGRLAVIVGEYLYQGPRRKYSQTKATCLADMAPQILAGMAEHAAFQKDRRQKAEDDRRAYAEREARRRREEAFAAREKRRMEFIETIHVQLAQRARLTVVLAHLENAEGDHAWRVATMAGFVRRRLAQIDALTNAFSLGISADFAEIEFDEVRATAKADGVSEFRYYARPAELQFWSIDMENELARSKSPLQWAIEAGHAPGLEIDKPSPDLGQPT